MKKMRNSFPFVLLLFTFLLISCSKDDDDDSPLPPDMPSMENTTIWSGPTIVFQKNNGADPTLEENQDRITNSVWITRGNGGGQIYNASSETEADKDLSPAGTLWAKGTTANLQNLTFGRFRAALGKPKDNVGVNLVMLLVDDNIAIDVTFTGWSQQELGGFIYERSSNQ
jgi:hypothetical protein